MEATLIVFYCISLAVTIGLFIWWQLGMNKLKKIRKEGREDFNQRIAAWDERIKTAAFMSSLARYLEMVENDDDFAPADTKEMAQDIKTILNAHLNEESKKDAKN